MLTAAQISGATGDALQRLGIQVQDAAFEDQKDTNARFEARMVVEATEAAAELAEAQKQATALAAVAVDVKRIADAQTAQAAVALNKKQQAFFDLYSVNLKARKDPAVITSATADLVVKDVALDAMMMTLEVWPAFKQAMASMEVPPGGVDWS